MIGALVVVRREELVDQVAMRAMDFDAAETGLFADGGTTTEALDDVLNFCLGGFLRCLEKRRHVRAKWHRRWRDIARVQAFG